MSSQQEAAWSEAVELINSAQLADANDKADHLKGVQEIVVHRQPALLQQILPELANFQRDGSSAVRKFLAELLANAALPSLKAKPDPAILTAVLAVLHNLAGDEAASVAKAAIAACSKLFKPAFAAVAEGGRAPGFPGHFQQLWIQVLQVKERVCGFAVAHPNDGVRLNAVKFLELSCVLLSSDIPRGHALLQPSMLAKEAQASIGQLVGILKAPGIFDLPGTIAVVAFRTAASIGTQRPVQLGRILPTILAVANSAAKTSAENGKALALSVHAALKGALLTLLRCRDGPAIPWHPKLVAALRKIGEGDEADKELRRAEKAAKRERPTEPGAQASDSKRQRTDSSGTSQLPAASNAPAQLHSSAAGDPRKRNAHPASHPTSYVQQQQQQQHQPVQYSGAQPPHSGQQQQQHAVHPAVHQQQDAHTSVAQPQHKGPHATKVLSVATTPQKELEQVLAVIGHLLATNEDATCKAFVNGLPAEVLADMVMANMSHLPRREEVTSATKQPSGASGLSGLVQGLAAAAPSAQPAKAAAQPLNSAAQQQQQQQPLPAESAAVPAPRKVPQASPPPPPVPTAVQMTKAEMQALRKGAITRILHGPGGAAEGMRTTLLARLASLAPEGDKLADEILQYILEDFHGRGGLQLAQQWLSALAISHCHTGQHLDSGSNGQAGQQPSSRDLAGTPYESVLLALLEGLRDQLQPSDRTIAHMILEAPALPGVPQFLGDLMEDGGEASTLALSTLRELMMSRPLDREASLEVVLQATVHADADLRSKAIRLTGNRLLPEPFLEARILDFAAQHLRLLGTPSAAAGGTPGSANGSAEPAASTAEAQPHGAAGNEAEKQPGADVVMEDEQEQQERRRAAAESEAAQHSELFCALCTKRRNLLRPLMLAYAQARPEARGALHRNAPGLARVLGPPEPALLELVKDHPQGSQALLLQMLEALTDSEAPPQELVQHCQAQYSASGDARFLVPVLSRLAKDQVARLMPQLVQLEAPAFSAAVHRLLRLPSSSSGQALMTPTELLVSLHSVATDPAAGPTVRQLIMAVDGCLADKATFHKDVLASSLQQLLPRQPLPVLFMRFAMQAQAAAPSLGWLLLDILEALISRSVWADQQQWRGWLLAAAKHAPASFPAFLQLPVNIMKTVLEDGSLQKMPPAFKTALADFAKKTAAAQLVNLLSDLPEYCNRSCAWTGAWGANPNGQPHWVGAAPDHPVKTAVEAIPVPPPPPPPPSAEGQDFDAAQQPPAPPPEPPGPDQHPGAEPGAYPTQEQLQALPPDQQAAYWEQWAQYYAQFQQPQPDAAQQHYQHQYYQGQQAQQYGGQAPGYPPQPDAQQPNYYQQYAEASAAQGYASQAYGQGAGQGQVMTHSYAPSPYPAAPAAMPMDYGAMGMNPVTGLPTSQMMMQQQPQQPEPKKPSVPAWLKAEMAKRGIQPGALAAVKQDTMDDESAPGPVPLPRRFSEASGGSRWLDDDKEGGTVGGLKALPRARAESPSRSLEDDSSGDEAAEAAARQATVNLEIKRHLTSILLEVTDPLFSTLASEALREFHAAARAQPAVKPDAVSGGAAKDVQESFDKGDRVWYVARDGARAPATVVSVDISHPPPFYGVRLKGSEGIRETEGHRLVRMTTAETGREFVPEDAANLGPASGSQEATTNAAQQAASRSRQQMRHQQMARMLLEQGAKRKHAASDSHSGREKKRSKGKSSHQDKPHEDVPDDQSKPVEDKQGPVLAADAPNGEEAAHATPKPAKVSKGREAKDGGKAEDSKRRRERRRDDSPARGSERRRDESPARESERHSPRRRSRSRRRSITPPRRRRYSRSKSPRRQSRSPRRRRKSSTPPRRRQYSRSRSPRRRSRSPGHRRRPPSTPPRRRRKSSTPIRRRRRSITPVRRRGRHSDSPKRKRSPTPPRRSRSKERKKDTKESSHKQAAHKSEKTSKKEKRKDKA
ncbi:hypothetical protein WJX73_008046 [Symbiochloris irregularis]|uniref:Symplekin n=1 Tax=Symbiochloris irregularis TaxID=706552 RepID=A0AAW1NQE3_9CHLO